jgi:hypothetical protein
MNPGRLAIVLLSLAAPSALAAQSAPPAAALAAKPDIVVSGQQQTIDRQEVTRQARAVSRETDLWYEPMPRFAGYACPGVMGLSQAYAESFVGRLRQIAEQLKIPLAKNGDCSANIIVVFTQDGRADLKELQKKSAALSRQLEPQERRELLKSDGPAHVFSVVETRMQNGSLVPRRQNPTDIPVGQMEGGQSRISTGTEREISQVLVLFDRDKLKGKTLQQLADYTIMRVYARTRDAHGQGAPDTILALFDPANDTPPLGLTEFDRAYLTSLYEGEAHVKGITKLERVGENLQKLRDINHEDDE